MKLLLRLHFFFLLFLHSFDLPILFFFPHERHFEQPQPTWSLLKSLNFGTGFGLSPLCGKKWTHFAVIASKYWSKQKLAVVHLVLT